MRNSTAYGVSPRLRLDIVLNNLAAWAHTTGAIRLLSDGSAWRPLVHVRDIAKATLALLDAPADAIRGRAFNIGTDEQNYMIRELPRSCAELPGCEVETPRAHRRTPAGIASTSRDSEAFPDCTFEWTAELGADELATAYAAVGLTADELSGERYLRLGRIKHLLADGALSDALRWT